MKGGAIMDTLGPLWASFLVFLQTWGWKLLAGAVVLYILYLAFLKPCPKPPVKEAFQGGCASCPKKPNWSPLNN
jgi:hypothetical protein